MNFALTRVLESFATRSPDLAWVDATALLTRERSAVDEYLDSDVADPVYGFTTRLGHEDTSPLSVEQQRDLLRNHLVGPSADVAEDWRHLLAAVKAEQLHHGGSGVHPDVYSAVLEALKRGGEIRGNWLNSYSCGDVVPGAWFARDLMDASDELLTHSGDLITIINGHFVSTSLSMIATASLVNAVASLLAVWSADSAEPAAQRRQTSRPPGSEPLPQAPVSLRDSAPVLAAFDHCFSALGLALEGRLAAPSCNPRFDFEPDGVHAVSQSSFLDYRLTFALTNAVQVAALTAGLWQRVIQHRCSTRGPSTEHVSQRIQAPKTAQGLLERIRLAASMPTAFSGFDSEGIEDLRDLSLISAQTLIQVTRMLGDFEGIWISTGAQLPGPEILRLRRKLLGQILNSGTAAAQLGPDALTEADNKLIQLRTHF